MRRSMWIAWLLLCLLPLRGWAQGGMPVGPALPASTAAEVPSLPAAALPCHEADAASSSSSAEDPAPAGTCTACDLCHVAALPADGPRWPPLGAPRTTPSATPVPDTGRGDPDRLERPPRTGLVR
jgi:hypothetical protein